MAQRAPTLMSIVQNKENNPPDEWRVMISSGDQPSVKVPFRTQMMTHIPSIIPDFPEGWHIAQDYWLWVPNDYRAYDTFTQAERDELELYNQILQSCCDK